jgi:hypothetical protein
MRALIFAFISVVVLTWMERVDQAGLLVTDTWPHPSFIGSTWYGPVLVALIPLSCFWLALSMKIRFIRIVLFVVTALLAFEWYAQMRAHRVFFF